MSDPTPSLIDLRAVSFAPEGKAVLSDISFRAAERRIGIVGRNGSGKTTLARVLAGLIAPDGGEVLVDGIAVARDR